MSEFSTPEERTEMPTDRRMGQLRKKGQLFHSVEISHVVSLTAGFIMLTVMWPILMVRMQEVLIKSFKMIALNEPLTSYQLRDGFIGLLIMLGPTIITMVFVVALAASLSVLLQTNWNVKEKKIEFKFDMIHPLNGIKRIISIHGFINVLKAILKLAIILPIAYFGLKAIAPQMIMLVHLSVFDVLAFTGTSMGHLFWKVMYVLIALALFDYVWGKFRWLKQNKMTKEEVKDERKSVEGDETTKRKIIQKGMRRLMQRIMDSVPKADVVITNPTHYAVALRYDKVKMGAPIVVAKGQGFLALRIREIARQNGVPVIERKPLARALYASCEIGAEIPYELFKAVAEVLAYVYRLKNPYRTFANSSVGQESSGANQ